MSTSSTEGSVPSEQSLDAIARQELPPSAAAGANDDDASNDDAMASASPDEDWGPPQDDWVECFFSGKVVPPSKATRVRLGPGQKVWMLKSYTRAG